jgi:hypothetical protein
MDEGRLLDTLRNLSSDLIYLRQALSAAGRHSSDLATIADQVMHDADTVAELIRGGTDAPANL